MCCRCTGSHRDFVKAQVGDSESYNMNFLESDCKMEIAVIQINLFGIGHSTVTHLLD